MFSRNQILEVPSATFCNREYSVLNDFCYLEFLANYALGNKLNQPNELDHNLIENSHEKRSYSKKVKFMISGKTMPCPKVRRIL